MRGLVLVAMVTLLVGCGGSSGDDDVGAPATPTTAPVAAATATHAPSPATAASTEVPQAVTPTATRAATPTEPPLPSPTATEAVPTPVVMGSPAAGLPLAGQVSATVPVGVGPLAVAAGHGAIWVYSDMDGAIARIDPTTNTVVATIPVATPLAAPPSDLLGLRQANPDLAIDASSVWAIKPEEQAIVRIDPQTNAVVATIALEAKATSIAVDGTSLWVSLYGASSIARIDTATGEIVATIRNIPTPFGIAVQQDAVWVTNHLSNTVTRIDPETNEIVATIPVSWRGAPLTGFQCSLCASEVLANEHGVWVALLTGNAVARIDPATDRLTAVIPVGIQPRSLASDARGLWVGHMSSAGVLLIAPAANQVVGAVPATESPTQFGWIALAENTIWAARLPANDAVRIDLLPE